MPIMLAPLAAGGPMMLTGVGSAVAAGATALAGVGLGGYTLGGVAGSVIGHPVMAGYLAATGVGLAYDKSKKGIIKALRHPNKKIQEVGKMGARIYRKASHPLIRGFLQYAGANKIATLGVGVHRVGKGKNWDKPSLKSKISKQIRKHEYEKRFEKGKRPFDL